MNKFSINDIFQELFLQIICFKLKSNNINILFKTNNNFRNIIKLNKKFLYGLYWKNLTKFYHNGNIMSTLIKKDNIPISYNEYWDNGIKKKIGFYKNGMKNGIWRSWHKDGSINCIIPYTNDSINGFYKEFLPNGNILRNDRFVDGVFSPYLLDEYFNI